jgi:hypothetical protein
VPATTGEFGDRLDLLERRVADLEAARRSDSGSAGHTSGEPFWIMEGIKERFAGGSVVVLAGHVTLDADREYDWQQFADASAMVGGDWSELAGAIAALAHPVRLALLRAIVAGTSSAAQLGVMEGFGTSGQLYHHLRTLVSGGWLRSTGRGRYEVPETRMIPLLVVLAACRR